MDKLSAFFAFAVEAGFGRFVAFAADVLKTGGAAAVDDVFVYDSFVNKVFKLAVNRRLRDGGAVALKVAANVARGDMRPGDGPEIIEQKLTLFRFIF
jgi:hypothetical protein